MSKRRELAELIKDAKSVEDVKEALAKADDKFKDIDPEKLYEEFKHQLSKNEKLDLDELDRISGGKDRNWWLDGCAATCEEGSWCWSNDWCSSFEVTYQEFGEKCTNGQRHDYYLISWTTAHGSGWGGWVYTYGCRRCGQHFTYNETLPGVKGN